MDCNCGYRDNKKEWNKIEISSQGTPVFIGKVPERKLGLGIVDILVCPDCGALYSDMNGETTRNE